ncbi:excinuclease ABC subunit C [Candidatus Desantisbacteria bacterium CG2_30_40_21]|uniref:Excinuclease ABC subunit C n=5 Tax=unclassified Candidatus Desantisiibacteriota TaxID=3106372 RepID=A0A2M7J9B8_9BACT|nr:MAG: excinuclease ABC subunit C [Candidatus Desantisbacteria bacterium CG2_30_40_21]PIP39705.1 MAG: excinuclease ABC subunit C [Candidatus Desantisbacteria bacterium CG23_combo_of_CG06-09_8_20_14_all_40_23]PIX16007.1 MAG: excinuclease ABC subunit C [Candidatus Desantisbacteria bacterium CG_4_8_14_3_um_filter_40_12]PIY19035.1 MAG: excinuclease ABC subunit C [Candidatus Desantisbacteria bacterium CG_4_10_14_3_um_filter_40_18]PJB29520.1 MAG: excinuclease ABC subunit C [Candidatus Desantisbacter
MKENTTQNLYSVSSLPDAIGVYLFKDINEKVLYVGKATSLIKRVRSYFVSNNTWKARQLLQYAHKIDYILTASENEALILECNLIKTHCPKYNVLLKDDKAYPYIKITLNEDYPRMLVVRKTKNDGAAYFGPYTNTSAMRRTMRMIRETFLIRDCKQKIKPSITKSPCLNYHIKQCAGPCAQKIDMEGYQRIIKEVCLFLEGKMDSLIVDMTERMKKEAVLLRFEQAARIRDQLKDIEQFMARQRMVINKPVDIDEFILKQKGMNLKLSEVKALLNLKNLPLRIEAFDISNISGKMAVGSMVVFVNGKPETTEYRKFKIQGEFAGQDDFGMIEEVVSRRYKKVLAEDIQQPDLIMVDGGKGQLNAAFKVLSLLGLEKIPLISIAKPQKAGETDRIFTLCSQEPLPFQSDSNILHLFQYIRDEAHRFAISFHRKIREKNQIGI